MTGSEIATLVASIFSAISAIAAVVTCFLMYRNSRPKIKLQLATNESARGHWHDDKTHFAVLAFGITNSSQQSGVVSDIVIRYNGNDYRCEEVSMNYDTGSVSIKSDTGEPSAVERNMDQFRLKCPIKVDGYSVVSGVVVFPNFPAIDTNNFFATVIYRLAHKKVKRKIRKVKFSYLQVR